VGISSISITTKTTRPNKYIHGERGFQLQSDSADAYCGLVVVRHQKNFACEWTPFGTRRTMSKFNKHNRSKLCCLSCSSRRLNFLKINQRHSDESLTLKHKFANYRLISIHSYNAGLEDIFKNDFFESVRHFLLL
jgi:hypothetical protein